MIVAPPQYVLSAITTESYAEEYQRTIDQGAQGRDIHTLQLFKPEGSSLGFSVVGLRSEQKGELGIFIQEIQPTGIAGRSVSLLIMLSFFLVMYYNFVNCNIDPCWVNVMYTKYIKAIG